MVVFELGRHVLGISYRPRIVSPSETGTLLMSWMRNCPKAGNMVLKLAVLDAVPSTEEETRRAEGSGKFSLPARGRKKAGRESLLKSSNVPANTINRLCCSLG